MYLVFGTATDEMEDDLLQVLDLCKPRETECLPRAHHADVASSSQTDEAQITLQLYRPDGVYLIATPIILAQELVDSDNIARERIRTEH